MRAQPLIAVVNDDRTFMSLLRDFLQGEGYRVVTWPHAGSARERLRHERPDLLILDARMQQPEAGGHILELMRRDAESARLPAIVCSADSLFLRRNRAFLASHANVVLEKPFDLDDLLAAIHDLVGKPTPRSPHQSLGSDASC